MTIRPAADPGQGVNAAVTTRDRKTREALERYLGREVHAADGTLLGHVSDVLADARGGALDWLVVRLVGPLPRHRAIPLRMSIEVTGRLLVPTSRAALRSAPAVRPGRGLTAPEELRQRHHWSDV